jgi:hypothetical protein
MWRLLSALGRRRSDRNAAVHWIASGDFETDYWRWQILSLFAFCAGVLGIGQLSGLSWGAAFALLAVLLFALEPLHSEIRVGNVNNLQLGLLALYLCCQKLATDGRGWLAAGRILGIGVMFKPNLVGS